MKNTIFINFDLKEIELKDDFDLYLNLQNKYNWKLHLEKNDILSSSYRSNFISNEGVLKSESNYKIYKGYINDDPKNIVRLIIYDNTMAGYFNYQDSIFYLKPLRNFIHNDNESNDVVFYNINSLLEKMNFGDDYIENFDYRINKLEGLKSLDLGDPVRMLIIAVEGDYEYYQNHGAYSEIDIIESINNAEGVYCSTFNISFNIDFINVYTTSSDPYTVPFCMDSTTRTAFINEIESHFDSDHSNVYFDVAYLYTGKTYPNLLGFARQPGSYGTVSDKPNSDITFAHELGHNLNANHSDADCVYPKSLMCSILNGITSIYFTEENIDNIEDNISSRLTTYTYFQDDVLCSAETFSISNPPSGSTISWPKSGTLAFDGSSTGSTVTIEPDSHGEGWVEPTISKGSTTVSFSKDYFGVDEPNAPYNILCVYCYQYCVGQEYIFQVEDYNDLFTTSYYWSVNYAGHITYGQGGPSVSVYMDYPYQADISVYAYNTCGSSSVTHKYVYVSNCGRSLMVYPNPAADEITFSMDGSQELSDDAVYEIYDNNMNKLVAEPLKTKEKTINISGLKKGLYYISVYTNGELITEKFLKD